MGSKPCVNSSMFLIICRYDNCPFLLWCYATLKWWQKGAEKPKGWKAWQSGLRPAYTWKRHLFNCACPPIPEARVSRNSQWVLETVIPS